MVKLSDLRRRAIAHLADLRNDSPKADVDLILLKLLNIKKTEIILGDRELNEDEIRVFEAALERLKSGEPVQYVVGECEFMSLKFEVNSSTLVPRADTEILVEKVIELCKNKDSVKILDIGCGSGCIAISLAYYLPKAQILAIDISTEALETAKRNAEALSVSDRVEFIKHDIMQNFPTDFHPDVVVSNPPYIPSKDCLELDFKVRGFEPQTALDGGADGFDFYRQIVNCAEIQPNGYLAFEVGINQAEQVAEMMKEKYVDIEITRDLSGIERVVAGKKNG